MTPTVGDRVRLFRLFGVASTSLRAQVGQIGEVVEVQTDDRGVRHLVVAFETPAGVADRFWLRCEEVELVGEEGEV